METAPQSTVLVSSSSLSSPGLGFQASKTTEGIHAESALTKARRHVIYIDSLKVLSYLSMRILSLSLALLPVLMRACVVRIEPVDLAIAFSLIYRSMTLDSIAMPKFRGPEVKNANASRSTNTTGCTPRLPSCLNASAAIKEISSQSAGRTASIPA